MFTVHTSQGRYLSGFVESIDMDLLGHLILWNLKVMSSFKKCLKTCDVDNTRVGIMAMKMNSTELPL